MFTDEKIQTTSLLPAPPPPPAPPPAPDMHVQPYHTRKAAMSALADHTQDPDIQKILQNDSTSAARIKALNEHIALLKGNRTLLDKKTETLGGEKSLNERTYKGLEASTRDIDRRKVSIESELSLIDQIQRNGSEILTPAELEEAKESLTERRQSLIAELTKYQREKDSLIIKNKDIDSEIEVKKSERLALNKKISNAEKILREIKEKNPTETQFSTKALNLKSKYMRDEEETALSTLAKSGLFIHVEQSGEKPKEIFYTPEQILALKTKLGLFKTKDDLHASFDERLENILRWGIQMGSNDTPLGSKPREKLREYLKIDVIQEHERREREKKRAEEQKRIDARERERIETEQKRKAREAERAEAEKQLQNRGKGEILTPRKSTKRSFPEDESATGSESPKTRSADTPNKRPALQTAETPGKARQIGELTRKLAEETEARRLAEVRAIEESNKRQAAEEESKRVKRAREAGEIASQIGLPALATHVPPQLPAPTPAQMEYARTQAAIASMDGW